MSVHHVRIAPERTRRLRQGIRPLLRAKEFGAAIEVTDRCSAAVPMGLAFIRQTPAVIPPVRPGFICFPIAYRVTAESPQRLAAD